MGLEAAVSWLHLGLQLAAVAPTTEEEEEEEEEEDDGDTKHKGGQQGRNPPGAHFDTQQPQLGTSRASQLGGQQMSRPR